MIFLLQFVRLLLKLLSLCFDFLFYVEIWVIFVVVV